MASIEEITQRLAAEDAVLVSVHDAQGSVPREPGAWMLVFVQAVHGTIGGGHLEFDAIAHARRTLAGEAGDAVKRYALGPSLGQCCGGVVHLRFERIGRAEAPALVQRLRAELAPLACSAAAMSARRWCGCWRRCPSP